MKREPRGAGEDPTPNNAVANRAVEKCRLNNLSRTSRGGQADRRIRAQAPLQRASEGFDMRLHHPRRFPET